MEIPIVLYSTAAILALIILTSYVIRLYFEHKELKENYKNKYRSLNPPRTSSPIINSNIQMKPMKKFKSQSSISAIDVSTRSTPIQASTRSTPIYQIVGKIKKLTKNKYNNTSTPENEPLLQSIDEEHKEYCSEERKMKDKRNQGKDLRFLNETAAHLFGS